MAHRTIEITVLPFYTEERTSWAVSFVAASLSAPGFELAAEIPMYLALRRWN